MRRSIKAVLLLGGLAVIAIVAMLVYNALSTPKSGVKLVLVPNEVELRYNNTTNSVKNNQVLKLHPGDYTLQFSRDGFEPEVHNVKVSEGKTTSLMVALKALTPEAKRMISDPDSQRRLEMISGYEIDKGGSKLEEDNPILKELPIVDKYFVINPCEAMYKKSGIALCIQAIDDFHYNRALEELKRRGYNPDDFEIKRV